MFLNHVHAMRGLAISLVVLAHAKLAVEWQAVPSLNERALRAFIEGSTVPFFFLAGYLFQRGLGKFRYGAYLRGKLRYVVVPYLVWATPALLNAYVFRWGMFEKEGLTSWAQVGELLYQLATARHMFVPFWFIPTLGVMYLLAPALRKLDDNPRLYRVLLPPLILASSVMHLSPLYRDVLHDAFDMLPIYILGMAVSHHGERGLELLRANRHLLLGTSLVLAAISVAVSQTDRITSEHPFSTENGIIDYALLQKTALTLWLFELLARLDASGWLGGSGFYKVTSRLADLSFGIFFVHMYVMNHVFKAIAYRLVDVPAAGWLSVLGITAVYYGITVAVVSVAKRVSGQHSRLLLGC